MPHRALTTPLSIVRRIAFMTQPPERPPEQPRQAGGAAWCPLHQVGRILRWFTTRGSLQSYSIDELLRCGFRLICGPTPCVPGVLVFHDQGLSCSGRTPPGVAELTDALGPRGPGNWCGIQLHVLYILGILRYIKPWRWRLLLRGDQPASLREEERASILIVRDADDALAATPQSSSA